MNEAQATSKVDTVLAAILENHPSLFGNGVFIDADNARAMAQAVAAFRQELIALYAQQPV